MKILTPGYVRSGQVNITQRKLELRSMISSITWRGDMVSTKYISRIFYNVPWRRINFVALPSQLVNATVYL